MPLWMLVRQGMFFLNLIVFLGMLLYECSGQKKRTELFMDLVVFLSVFCMATAFYSMDLVLEQSSMSIFTAISGCGILYAWIRVFLLSYKRKQRMSVHVIQESFDNLPCGIAFFDGHGFPRLVNRQMQAVFQMLMGHDLQSEEELRKVLHRDMEETFVIYPCRNGQVWQLTEDRIVSESGKQYTQFLAFDVSELYEKKQELEQENRKLEEISVSLKELSRTMMQVTREEEVLALKMKVHDELGYHVLATQQMLTENPDHEKIQELLNRWKRTICLLQAEPEGSEKKGFQKRNRERRYWG